MSTQIQIKDVLRYMCINIKIIYKYLLVQTLFKYYKVHSKVFTFGLFWCFWANIGECPPSSIPTALQLKGYILRTQN